MFYFALLQKYIKKTFKKTINSLTNLNNIFHLKDNYPQEISVMKYIRDSASFHFKRDYIDRNVYPGEPRTDQLIGLHYENYSYVLFVNTVGMHLKEIGRIASIEVFDGTPIINYLHNLLSEIIVLNTDLLENIILEFIKDNIVVKDV